jgi:hypothetical protein
VVWVEWDDQRECALLDELGRVMLCKLVWVRCVYDHESVYWSLFIVVYPHCHEFPMSSLLCV